MDRVHDLLLCGIDPSLVDLSMCLVRVEQDDDDDDDDYEDEDDDDDDEDYEDDEDSEDDDDYEDDEDGDDVRGGDNDDVDPPVDQEIEFLLRVSSLPWRPSRHAFLYGPQFRACIASLCLVKVRGVLGIAIHHLLSLLLNFF